MKNKVNSNGSSEMVLELPQIQIKQATFQIVGVTPLIVNKFSEKAIQMILDKQTKKANKGREAKNPMELYNSALLNFERLHAGDYHFSVDDTVGRFHSNITNMPSKWRVFLTLDGQELISLDIRNCQPYLSIAPLHPNFFGFQKNFAKICERAQFRPNLDNLLEMGEFNVYNVSTSIARQLVRDATYYASLIMSVNPPESHARQGIERYKMLCSDGIIYEYLEKRFGEELGTEFENREAVKVAMFQILFTDNRFISSVSALPKRMFKDIFKPVYDVFYQLKRKDKTILPRLLQSMESYLVLHVICKRIHKEKPKLPLLTVHDSIVTTRGNEEYVKGVMEEELTRHIGLPPQIKAERWHPDEVKYLYRI